jgi:hypothetical protein
MYVNTCAGQGQQSAQSVSRIRPMTSAHYAKYAEYHHQVTPHNDARADMAPIQSRYLLLHTGQHAWPTRDTRGVRVQGSVDMNLYLLSASSPLLRTWALQFSGMKAVLGARQHACARRLCMHPWGSRHLSRSRPRARSYVGAAAQVAGAAQGVHCGCCRRRRAAPPCCSMTRIVLSHEAPMQPSQTLCWRAPGVMRCSLQRSLEPPELPSPSLCCHCAAVLLPLLHHFTDDRCQTDPCCPDAVSPHPGERVRLS